MVVLLLINQLGERGLVVTVHDSKKINVRLDSRSIDDFLDPTKLKWTLEYIYLDNLTTRLVGYDKAGKYVGRLASNIEVIDKKTFIFELSEQFFSDGNRINCVDVKESFKRAILKGVPHAKPKEFIKGADKLTSFEDEIEGLRCEEGKFVLSLVKPVKEIYYFLQLTDFAIYPPELVKKDILYVKDWEVNSSGAYKIGLDGENVTLELNSFSKEITPFSPSQINFNYKKDSKDSLDLSKFDFGKLKYAEYKNIINVGVDKNVFLYGNQTAGILFLSLNSMGVFREHSVRKKIRNLIHTNLRFSDNELLTKTYQYFLPGARGYIKDLSLDDFSEKIDAKLPEVFKIYTVRGMKSYLPNNFKEILGEALGIPVEIEFEENYKNFSVNSHKKNYDAIVMSASMSYKVLAEALNMIYNAEPREAFDPTKNINKLLEEYSYSMSEDKDEEIIRKILEQMTEDAEIIPLFYQPSADFYNTDKLDVSDLYLTESMQFWKLKLKE